MPQLENKEILEPILKSTINIISRRTSEAYANVIIGNAVKGLEKKYPFLKYVHIKGTQYTEIFDILTIDEEIENTDIKKIGESTKEFIENISKAMGKNAGYFFIKEIKEDLPFTYEQTIKNLGVDLDFLQLEFITEIKDTYKFQIENYDILKTVFKAIFDVLDKNLGRDTAFRLLNEFITRLSIEYPVLKYIKINDIRVFQNIEAVTINKDVNKVQPKKVGASIQKCVQELNYYIIEKKNFSLIDKLKNALTTDYLFKLEEIDVNFDIIQLKQTLVFKHILKALVDILSESSSERYAILIINNIIRKHEERFNFLKNIQIDKMYYNTKQLAGVVVPTEIDTVRESDLGRSIQKIIESIIESLGEDASRDFIEKFKERLGKAYILRIEEIGVNLHMIELRQNLMW